MSRTYFFRSRKYHKSVLYCDRGDDGEFGVINGAWNFRITEDGEYYFTDNWAPNKEKPLDIEFMPVGQVPKEFSGDYNDAIAWARKKVEDENIQCTKLPDIHVERRVADRRVSGRRSTDPDPGDDDYEDDIPF